MMYEVSSFAAPVAQAKAGSGSRVVCENSIIGSQQFVTPTRHDVSFLTRRSFNKVGSEERKRANRIHLSSC
jgi:hypothetical protein